MPVLALAIVVTCVCVGVYVCQPQAYPRDNFRPTQVRITKMYPRGANTLVNKKE